MANNDYRVCGDLCRRYRQEVLKVTQKEAAEELEYTQENISAFENGRNSNNIIFMWYVRKGILEPRSYFGSEVIQITHKTKAVSHADAAFLFLQSLRIP